MRTPKVIYTAAALIAVAGCTPAQLDTWEAATGQHIVTGRAALIDLPDRPMALPDGRTIAADGNITTANRPGRCDQWADVFIAAGWPADIVTQWATAVMWRETRCQPGAISRWGDYGLMQINRVVLADMRQRPWLWASTIDTLGGIPSPGDLLDPSTNATVALGLYAIRGARPWT